VTGKPNGEGSLTSFNASTGAVVNSFLDSYGEGTVFAVAEDDVTLYIPGENVEVSGGANFLDVVSGQSGSELNSISLPYAGLKVVLSSDGATAYVLASSPNEAGRLVVVDIATLTVTGSVAFRSPAYLQDIALSPDNSTLYAAVGCNQEGACIAPKTVCPLVEGICNINASTLALESTVEGVHGLLSVSQSGASLYVVATDGELYVVNTSTLAVSSKPQFEDLAGPIAIVPAGNWGVAVNNAGLSGATVYLLNTTTNEYVETPLTTAPGGASAVGGAAIAPNGRSAWMILGCSQPPPSTCGLPDGGPRGLLGISLPSGAVIAETALPDDASNIAVPPPASTPARR
jgi:DNA-binding beta-propeller fold protein YncE